MNDIINHPYFLPGVGMAAAAVGGWILATKKPTGTAPAVAASGSPAYVAGAVAEIKRRQDAALTNKVNAAVETVIEAHAPADAPVPAKG